MGKTVWENYVYQPLSSAIIRFNRENQKFLGFTNFSSLIWLSLQSLSSGKKELRSGLGFPGIISNNRTIKGLLFC
jgi:hypothetical protein